MSGRPKNKAFEELGFILVKNSNKYSALCTVCNKNLQNTAENRLRRHRTGCRPSIVTFESDDVLINGVLINGDIEELRSDQYNSENAMSVSSNNEGENQDVIVNKTLEKEPLSIGSNMVFPTTTRNLSIGKVSSEFHSWSASTSTSNSSLSSSSKSLGSSSSSLPLLPLPTATFKANVQRFRKRRSRVE